MNSCHRGEHARKEFAENGSDLLAGKAMANYDVSAFIKPPNTCIAVSPGHPGHT